MNELHSSGKKTVIKSDKYTSKNNSLSNNNIYKIIEMKTTGNYMNTKVSTNHTQDNSKQLK
jgi:hypothetical protein